MNDFSIDKAFFVTGFNVLSFARLAPLSFSHQYCYQQIVQEIIIRPQQIEIELLKVQNLTMQRKNKKGKSLRALSSSEKDQRALQIHKIRSTHSLGGSKKTVSREKEKKFSLNHSKQLNLEKKALNQSVRVKDSPIEFVSLADTCTLKKIPSIKKNRFLSLNSSKRVKLNTTIRANFNVESQKGVEDIKTLKNIHKNSLKTAKTTILEDFSQISEDLHKYLQILFQTKKISCQDQKSVTIDTEAFLSILSQSLKDLQQQKLKISEMQAQINKYHRYFKQLRPNHIPISEIQFDKSTNQSLKILKMEQKIETLNYIIKQYRSNNKQELKQFEVKVQNFKPNIEKELTIELASVNEKYEGLLKKVNFYQEQCQKSIKWSWEQLVTELEKANLQKYQMHCQIQKLSSQITQLQKKESKLQQFSALSNKYKELQRAASACQSQNEQLLQSIEDRNREISQLSLKCEQADFQQQAINSLQKQLQIKETAIKNNVRLISRLQCQNIELNSRLANGLRDVQREVFNEDKIKQVLLEANSTITSLTARLHMLFYGHEINSQTDAKSEHLENISFIEHAFERVKGAYNQIMSEYHCQLKSTKLECRASKAIISQIQRKQIQSDSFKQIVKKQLEFIDSKKSKCQNSFLNSFNKVNDQLQCYRCTQLNMHWGQMNSLYQQLKDICQRLCSTNCGKP